MKNKLFVVLVAAAFILSPLAISRAMETKTGNVHIDSEEIVGGNLYVLGDSITIDGTVNGDLIAVAQNINITGRIEGDLIALAQEINVSGEVAGNIRIASSLININGQIKRNLNALGTNITLGPASRVGWDAYLLGENLESQGVIDGSLNGRANNILLSGQIGKNVNFKINDKNTDSPSIILSENTIINGDFNYQANKEAEISPQAMIAGESKYKSSTSSSDKQLMPWLWKELFAIFGAFVVGLALIFVGKNLSNKILEGLKDEPTKKIIPGLLILIASPLIAALLALTLIGLPLALMIFTLWLIFIYIAKIFTAILIGKLIIEKTNIKKESNMVYALVVGVLVLWLLFSLPYIGWFINLLAICFGLGGLWKYVNHQSQNI